MRVVFIRCTFALICTGLLRADASPAGVRRAEPNKDDSKGINGSGGSGRYIPTAALAGSSTAYFNPEKNSAYLVPSGGVGNLYGNGDGNGLVGNILTSVNNLFG